MIIRLKSILVGLFVAVGMLYSQHNSAGYGLMLPNNVAIWTLVSLFLTLSLYRVLQQRKVFYSPLLVVFSVFLLVTYSLSLINTQAEKVHQILYMLAFSGVALFSFAVVQWQIKHTSFLKVLFVICLVGIFHALVSIVQVYDVYKAWYALIGYPPLGLGRGVPVGIVQQVNMNASILASVAVISLYLISHASVKKYPLIMRFVIVVAGFIAVFALGLTGSRAGWFGLVFGLILVVLARYRTMIKLKSEVLVWFMVVAVALILLEILPESSAITNKVSDIVEGRDIRLALYAISFSLIVDLPFWGYGLLEYKDTLKAFLQVNGIPPGFEHYKQVFSTFRHPHNEFIYWTIQGGWIVIIGLLVCAWFLLKSIGRQSKRHFFAVLGLAAPMLLQSQVSLPFSISILHLLLPIFFLFYAVKSQRRSISLSFNNPGVVLFKIAVLAFVPIFLILSYVTFKSVDEVYQYNQRLYTFEGYKKSQDYLPYATFHPSFSVELESYFNKRVAKDLRDKAEVELQNFLYWAENKSIEDRSLATIQNQLIVYQALGMENKAQQTLLEAQKLFPHFKEE